MILTAEMLEQHRGAAWAMVDGGFDPLHIGHLRYFEEAKKLGLPVFCNVQADAYLEQRKHRPALLPESQRAYLIDSLKTIDYVHLCQTTTADVLKRLAPRYYVKGGDWKDRGLPAEEVQVCRENGTEIIFLDTILDSSTNLSKRYFESKERHLWTPPK